MSTNLSTGQVAKAAGVNPETIRYYLKKGLIEEPDRTTAGYRLYPAETVKQIHFIKQAQRLGFMLAEIQDLLNIRIDSRQACYMTAGVINAKIRDVENKVNKLQALLERLKELSELCTKTKYRRGCPVLDCLEEQEETDEN